MPKPKDRCQECGGIKNAPVHSGFDWEHDFISSKEGWNQKPRRPLNHRSEKMEEYYEEERRPAVAEAVGNGRRPCPVESPVCTGFIESLHEPATRGRFGGLKKAVQEGGTVPCCNACNGYIPLDKVWREKREQELGYPLLLSTKGRLSSAVPRGLSRFTGTVGHE